MLFILQVSILSEQTKIWGGFDEKKSCSRNGLVIRYSFFVYWRKRGDVVKLTVVTLKTLFLTLSCYRFPLGIMISIN